MDKDKIKIIIGSCIAIVLFFGAYLFYMELDKGTETDNSLTTIVK